MFFLKLNIPYLMMKIKILVSNYYVVRSKIVLNVSAEKEKRKLVRK